MALVTDPTFRQRQPQRLAVKLSAAGERSVRAGHPWVFSDSIEKISADGKAGDLAIVFGKRSNSVMGVGLYDPDSPIVLKMLHHGGGATIDEAFFRSKIQAAFALRQELLQTNTNSYRLLFGENDGFPGLVVDVYATVSVLKLYSEIWLPYLPIIVPQVLLISETDTAVLRLSRKLQGSQNHDLVDGQVLAGNLAEETVQFKEHGLIFGANVVKGHKTGYFLDHRHNRKRVGTLARGKTVLDVFCYAGGFSVHALAGGAKEVTSIDISEQALKVAKKNASLNPFPGTHTTVLGDAFEKLNELQTQGKKFGLVVIDPPSFAASKHQIAIALKKYSQLATMGAGLTASKGTLVLASCSSRVVASQFFQLVEEALNKTGRKYRIEGQTEHDSDHPVTFPEGAYLKCGYYQFID